MAWLNWLFVRGAASSRGRLEIGSFQVWLILLAGHAYHHPSLLRIASLHCTAAHINSKLARRIKTPAMTSRAEIYKTHSAFLHELERGMLSPSIFSFERERSVICDRLEKRNRMVCT